MAKLYMIAASRLLREHNVPVAYSMLVMALSHAKSEGLIWEITAIMLDIKRRASHV